MSPSPNTRDRLRIPGHFADHRLVLQLLVRPAAVHAVDPNVITSSPGVSHDPLARNG